MKKLKTIDYLRVRCPKCHAAPGIACIHPKVKRPTFHLARRLEARRVDRERLLQG